MGNVAGVGGVGLMLMRILFGTAIAASMVGVASNYKGNWDVAIWAFNCLMANVVAWYWYENREVE